MKNRNLLILFGIITVIAIALQFISYDWLISILKSDFSSDEIIEANTLKHYKTIFVFLKIVSIVFPVSCIVFLIANKQISFFFNNLIKFIKIKLSLLYSKITIPTLFWFSVLFIVYLAVFALINFDIGQDESFYLNDIQNIEKHGAVYRDNGENGYYTSSQPLNVVANISVPIFGFSVIHIRLIILFFSFLLIVVINISFEKKITQVLVPLLFLFPGIFYLTSVIYLETTALLFILLGIIFLKKYEEFHKNKDFLFSALFMAIAIATKFQLFLWVGIILFILLIVEYKQYSILIFKYALIIYTFFGLMFIVSSFQYGYVNGITIFKELFIGGNSAGAFGFDFSKFINKILMLNEMIFLPLFIFIWVKSWKIIKGKYNNLYMKFIYVGAIVIVFHWLFFFSVMTWRNVFIGLAFNAILFALYLKENPKTAKLVLIPYIFFGIITNYGFISNGVLDDVQYYRAHVLDNFISTDSKNYQRDFFKEVNKIVNEDDIVYTPGQLYIPRIYMNNREIKFLKYYVKSEKKSYCVVYAGAVKERFVQKIGFTNLLENSEVVVIKGNYTLYKLP